MTLKINPERALEQIMSFLGRVDELTGLTYVEGNDLKSELDSEIRGFLVSAFENGDQKGYTSSTPHFVRVLGYVPSEAEKQEDYISSLTRMKRHLIRFQSEIQTFINGEVNEDQNKLDKLEIIFSNFHGVTRQLRQRHNNRETIDVRDEYDVQDLLHSILTMFFSDIRPEENTPSYAGNHRRMDFLLKPEKTVIEVKMTRPNLNNQRVSEQLNDDIITYKSHPDCDILVCFIYDPDGWINNPVGFETDLSAQSTDELEVKAYIFPKDG